MNETQRGLMESEQNAASDEYFGSRPQIDTTDRRRVFEAGFDRAWKALLPTVCDCTTETHADGLTMDLHAMAYAEEIDRLREAVALATPVMDAHAGPTRLAQFQTRLTPNAGIKADAEGGRALND
jgi:hypothetical protein